MKINEVEKLLGISKANIRFYEKEGLFTPGRSEKGYREYTDADIERLKQIVILRKLGIPVQQIADIQDGVLPLQDAIENNLQTLKEEIARLNGAVNLCKQIQHEQLSSLDTPRYWEIIQKKEQEGEQFHEILSDYINFMTPLFRDVFLIQSDADLNDLKKTFRQVLKSSLIIGAILFALSGFRNLWSSLLYLPRLFLFFCILYLPVFFIRRKKPELAKKLIRGIQSLFWPVILIIMVIFVVFFALKAVMPIG